MNVKIKKGNEIIAQSYQSPFIVKPERRTTTTTPSDGKMKVAIRKQGKIITAVDSGRFTVIDGKAVDNTATPIPEDNKEIVNETLFDTDPVVENGTTVEEQIEEEKTENESVINEEIEGQIGIEDNVTDEETNENNHVENFEEIPDGIPTPVKAGTTNTNTSQPSRKDFISTGSKFIPTEEVRDY